MGNTENKIRHIYCIEGNWNKHPHSNQSIKPILDLLFTFSKIKYIYKKCITKRDFIKGLQSFTQKRVCFSEVTNNCLRPMYNPIKNKPAVCQKRPAPRAQYRLAF